MRGLGICNLGFGAYSTTYLEVYLSAHGPPSRGSRFVAGWFKGREVVGNFEKFWGRGLGCIVLGFRVFPALGFRVQSLGLGTLGLLQYADH